MQLATVSLDDKYARHEGRIHITGSQAFVRLAMLQHIRDQTARVKYRLLYLRLPRFAYA